MRSVVLAVGTVVCMLLSSCGEEGDGTAASTTGLDSEPAEMVQRMVTDAAAAKSAKDCAFVARVNRRSSAKLLCPPPTADIRRDTRAMELTGAAIYGTGAVVDYRSRNVRDGALIVLSRNQQGLWSLNRFGLAIPDGDDEPDSSSREVVDRYLDAVRERDCETFFKYAVTQAPDARTACKQEFPQTRALGVSLQANSDARVRYLGGGKGIDFYALNLASPRPASYTISTATTPEGALRPHAVLDAERGPISP